MTIKSKLRDIQNILSGINRGYYSGKLDMFVMQVYGTNKDTAHEILAQSLCTIDELLSLKLTNDNAVGIFKEKGLSDNVIDYIMEPNLYENTFPRSVDRIANIKVRSSDKFIYNYMFKDIDFDLDTGNIVKNLFSQSDVPRIIN